MNKEWSELNKTMQAQIKKKDTYKRGIDTLLTLRSQLIQTLVSFKEELCREDFNSIPFINADFIAPYKLEFVLQQFIYA